MRPKAERKVRVKFLTDEWLTETLEAIRDKRDSGEELQAQFMLFALKHKIAEPQDKSLRNLIVGNMVRHLKVYSKLIKEARKGKQEVNSEQQAQCQTKGSPQSER